MEVVIISIVVILLCFLPGCIVQVNQYERGVLFSRGKFKKVLKPGWNFVIPIFQSYKKVDIRTKADDVPAQEAITKDNVSVKINAVLYYKIFDASSRKLLLCNWAISTNNNEKCSW